MLPVLIALLSFLPLILCNSNLPGDDGSGDAPTQAVIADPVGVVQCLPYTFTWTGGVPPYNFAIYNDDNENIFDIADINDTSLTWTPTQGVGATPDASVKFTALISDTSTFSSSQSAEEEITAGSIAVDAHGNCANAPVSITTTSTSSAPPSSTFTPVTIVKDTHTISPDATAPPTSSTSNGTSSAVWSKARVGFGMLSAAAAAVNILV
ncbi:hypothetical protein C8F01DRAFT_1375179 [Mycena amicta]|nr:hypothetical protein C8F01DRAFT_1375179 [Mycena amicta]